tara:strand:+ start:586 stop:1506 length:921 start_codon:yes stop_codon:yes gene_type:complete
MNVLSLFNGMSFGKMALQSLDIKVTNYYSSEIDKYANQATQALFPDTIQLGDVTRWREWNIDWASIDLVTGGFPCQAWSMAGKQLGDKDERGMLFWTMLDIIKHIQSVNPKVNFMIENVKMKKEFEEYITTYTENALGNVYKILINSALVSAQNRNRYYWTSFEVEQPEDKGILFADVLEVNVDESYSHSLTGMDYLNRRGVGNRNRFDFGYIHETKRDKSKCLVANLYKGLPFNTLINDCKNPPSRDNQILCRKLTPRECFRLQTVPEHHIDTLLNAGISNTQLYKMCGNGWTMDVIAHIFKGLK